jgi:hypothetical protein
MFSPHSAHLLLCLLYVCGGCGNSPGMVASAARGAGVKAGVASACTVAAAPSAR